MSKGKKLFIIDIRFRQKRQINDLLQGMLNDKDLILSLTPYSSYLLEKNGFKYITFHDLISIERFNKLVESELREIESVILDNKQFSSLFYFLSIIKTKLIFLNKINCFLEKKIKQHFRVIYVSDAKKDIVKYYDIMSNRHRASFGAKVVSEYINIDIKNIFFYRINKIKVIFYKILYIENIIKKVKEKCGGGLVFNYDNIHFTSFFEGLNRIKFIYSNIDDVALLNEFKQRVLIVSNSGSSSQLTNELFEDFFSTVELSILEASKLNIKAPAPFTLLADNSNLVRRLIYIKNKVPCVFMQHGSHIYENIALKYCEIYPADINFVFNEYSKALFLRRGVNNVNVVGSINFNKEYKKRGKKFDYVYITYCSAYAYLGTPIGSINSLDSADGMSIFQRHKEIIELFGVDFKEEKICIKIQAEMMLSYLYVPLLELSEKYSNITIEYKIPLHTLIEQSDTVVSDYFSSEFINRSIHYKKDIILFSKSPFPLPNDILDDMEKMFILVGNISDLKDRIKNIASIRKNKKKYDDIIEYYSSKDCDVKKMTLTVLERTFYGR